MNSTICCLLIIITKRILHSLRDARFPCVVPGAIFNIGSATAAPAGPAPTALGYLLLFTRINCWNIRISDV